MVELRLQPLQEGSVAPTDDEIVDSVLGVKSGYVRGLGHGELAPSRRDFTDNHSEVVQLRRRAEEAKLHLQELREEQVTQHETMGTLQQLVAAQQQQMAAQQQQMEEQKRMLELIMMQVQNSNRIPTNTS